MKVQTPQPAVPCPACGEGFLQRCQEVQDVEHAGHEGQVPVMYSVCRACGSELAGAEEALANKRAMIAFRKRAEGLMEGAAVRSFRERFVLSQETAAALFGGGKVAFSRYENDDVAQSGSMDTLLKLCDARPVNIRQIARMKGVRLGLETTQRLDDHFRGQLRLLGSKIQKELDRRREKARQTVQPLPANDSNRHHPFSLVQRRAEPWEEAA